MNLPRIQGRVGQADGGPHKDKWFFEIFLSSVGGGQGDPLGIFGPWDTKELALTELRNACRLACESIEKQATGKASGQYIDMHTNEIRNWDSH